jgi:glutathione S-transferase
MTRKLLGHLKSSNVMKAVWIMDELGLDYERIDIGNVWGGLDQPGYTGLNPTRLVPTLIDGEVTVWESNAILRYVANAYPGGADFYPVEPGPRAVVDQWLDCQQTQMFRPQTVVFFQVVRTAPENRDPAALAQGIKDAARVWGWIDARLAVSRFICGDRMTIADMAWGVHAHRWLNMDFDRPDLPHLRPWYDRLLERESFRTKWAGPIT